jgi:hypothetical protein
MHRKLRRQRSSGTNGTPTEYDTSPPCYSLCRCLLCVLIYCIPLTNHCPRERATPEPSTRCPHHCHAQGATAKGRLCCTFGRPMIQAVCDDLRMQRGRSLGFAETESRCIVVRVARLGIARRGVKLIISCKCAVVDAPNYLEAQGDFFDHSYVFTRKAKTMC